ncbi:CD276 antigen-like [Dendrobates tinctorius]|uniref:CD276 antigen-like n=1 Tax=Dendrobates tinctorius TaxID=92724 RepID=UPI003CC9B1BA
MGTAEVVICFIILDLVRTMAGFLTCEIQEQTVSFPQSGTAVLPCLFVPSQKASYQLVKVSWQKEHELEDLVVHFQNGKDTGDKQNEIFKGRTMMSKNWFIEGNATLTLGHLTHGDAGKFTCWVTAYPIRPGQQKRCCIVILKISNQPIKQQSTSQGNDGSPSPLDQALALFFLLLVLGVLCFLPILLTSKRFSRSWRISNL